MVAGVMRILEEQAAAQDFHTVKVVFLEVGALSHADPQAMRFAFDAQKPGTIAAAARLEIIDIPGQAWCLDCCAPVVISRRGDSCPGCGGYKLTVIGGDDVRVRELEVE